MHIEVRVNRVHVGTKPVCRQLVQTIGALAQIADKLPCALRVTVADVMRDYQLAFAIQRQPTPNTSPFFRSIGAQAILVAAHEGVKLIGLDKMRAYSANLRI